MAVPCWTGSHVGQQLVHLVHERDRPVDADLLGLFLRLAELAVPAAQLPFDVPVAAREVAEPDRVDIDVGEWRPGRR